MAGKDSKKDNKKDSKKDVQDQERWRSEGGSGSADTPPAPMVTKKPGSGWYGGTQSGRGGEDQGEAGDFHSQADGSSRGLSNRGAQPPARQGSSKQRGGIMGASKKKGSAARSKNSSSR